MTPRDCFGIILRTFGAILILTTFLYVNNVILVLLVPETPHLSAPAAYLIAAFTSLLVGLYFLRGARHLMRFAYPQDYADSDLDLEP